MQLTKDQILNGLANRVEQKIPVLALGGEITARELGRAQLRQAGEISRKHDSSLDVWHVAIMAYGLIDPNTKQPLFTLDELLALTQGDDPPLRTVVAQGVAQQILDLSEVGPAHLKSVGGTADAL